MNKQVSVHHKQHSLLDSIAYAYTQGIIDDEQKHQHLLTYKAFLLEQIQYFNHKQSTSISIKHYECLEKAIVYIVRHATSLPIYTQLPTCTVKQLYAKGLLRLKMEVAQCSIAIKQLQNISVYYPNDRYKDVLFHQIPNYIQLLHSYDAPFHYHHTKEDLDYPLIDGIPLFLHMYYKDGVDLIKEYLRRLQIEQQYCMRFSSTLQTFHSHYEQQHGIHSEDIHINVFEIVLNQCFVNIILFQKEAILLQRQDILQVKKYLTCDETAKIAKQRVISYIHTLPSVLQDYIHQHKDIIQREWMKFITGSYMLFVYEQEDEDILQVHIPESSKNFINDLYALQAIHTKMDKVMYLKEHKIQVYDMLDIFEHDIFLDDEYLYYFQHLQTNEVALIDILDEIDCEHPWHHYLKYYLSSQPLQLQQDILQLTQRIRLI